jgi:hypothetical protein
MLTKFKAREGGNTIKLKKEKKYASMCLKTQKFRFIAQA